MCAGHCCDDDAVDVRLSAGRALEANDETIARSQILRAGDLL